MLSEVFEEVTHSPRLVGIPQELGDERILQPPIAPPRICWVPTTDPYGPPDSLGYVMDTEDGRRVVLTSFALRKAGADVHLFTTYSMDGFKQMELLLHAFLYAMRDSLGVDLNWSRGPARWMRFAANERRDVWRVIQPIQVFVPVCDTSPTQILGTVQVTPVPNAPQEV